MMDKRTSQGDAERRYKGDRRLDPDRRAAPQKPIAAKRYFFLPAKPASQTEHHDAH